MVDYYLEKARSVINSQRFSEVMTSLKIGFKGGYRFGDPKTPFGHILQQLNVKLKPVSKKLKFATLLKKLRVDCGEKDVNTIQDILSKLMRRAEFILPFIDEEDQMADENLTRRLQARKAVRGA